MRQPASDGEVGPTSDRGRQTVSERNISVAANPATAGSIPWPQPDASSIYKRPVNKPSLRPAAAAPLASTSSSGVMEGLVGRVAGWLGGGAVPARAQACGRSAAAPPDFLAQLEDPDKRRRESLLTRASTSGSLEEQWRQECLAFARVRKLSHVEDMRIVYVDAEAADRAGNAVVVVVGAHYRPSAVTQEDVLLHTVKEMEKIGTRPYVVVYYNAAAQLGRVPDPQHFLELHTALHPGHRRQLQALYLVHPTALLRAWVFVLRLSEPDVYGKAVICERMADLAGHFAPSCMPKAPEHVADHEAGLLR